MRGGAREDAAVDARVTASRCGRNGGAKGPLSEVHRQGVEGGHGARVGEGGVPSRRVRRSEYAQRKVRAGAAAAEDAATRRRRPRRRFLAEAALAEAAQSRAARAHEAAGRERGHSAVRAAPSERGVDGRLRRRVHAASARHRARRREHGSRAYVAEQKAADLRREPRRAREPHGRVVLESLCRGHRTRRERRRLLLRRHGQLECHAQVRQAPQGRAQEKPPSPREYPRLRCRPVAVASVPQRARRRLSER
mmetsp:Transcript_25351/g.81998  ORF Transcript_25351/g.81998 Transcript_25351/m.81998 type:complete len:251 (-) Transcript_25351:214-966(-)